MRQEGEIVDIVPYEYQLLQLRALREWREILQIIRVTSEFQILKILAA